MKKNKKVSKRMSVVASSSMRLASIIVVLCVMVIFNILASSSCTRLMKTQGEMEKELAQLENDRLREQSSWEGMKTPEKIEAALLKHGLSMHAPAADQTVRMLPNGKPQAGQLSLARIARRGGTSKTAGYRSRSR